MRLAVMPLGLHPMEPIHRLGDRYQARSRGCCACIAMRQAEFIGYAKRTGMFVPWFPRKR